MWKARISDKVGELPVATVSKEKNEDFREYLDGEVRCYGVGHSGAAATHLHFARSFAFSATASPIIRVGITLV